MLVVILSFIGPVDAIFGMTRNKKRRYGDYIRFSKTLPGRQQFQPERPDHLHSVLVSPPACNLCAVHGNTTH
ncbi:hypothetical protein C8039_05565 [Halogeometricum sp. wsp3]|nr:hypothetical protein C8039_05565 [Halogeometricum sp. wsp3]